MIKTRSAVVEGCLCIGRAALQAHQYDASIKWLEIALEQLQELEDKELRVTDLEMHVRHNLGRCCIQSMEVME